MFKYKQLIVGIILGASITTATGAYAAVGDKLEAIVTQFNFVVNGKSVVIDTPIVTIADSSYLPVRSISNMLGYDITYKADSRTIELRSGAVVDGTYDNAIPSTPLPSVTPTAPNVDNKEVYYSFDEINSYFFQKNLPRLLSGVKNSKVFVTYNGNQYVVNDSSDYFYDNSTDKTYYSAEFLLQFLSDGILQEQNKFKVDITNKLVSKIN